MTNTEIATKAPESDAQETNTPPPSEPSSATATTASAPAPTSSSPKLSEHCTSDRPAPVGQSSTGEIRKLNDVDVYISKPADYPHAPARLLLLLTGGTGLQSVNNQIQADRFASDGNFLVVMPDLFNGDPAPNSRAAAEFESEVQSSGSSSLLDAFRLKAAETAKSFLIDMWLARHTEEKVLPLLERVLDGARDEFADAVANGGGVYGVGYCFGARYILLLGAERQKNGQRNQQGGSDEEANRPATTPPQLKAGALAHATMVSKEDFSGLKAPLSVVCVENDPMFPDEVRVAGEEYMSSNGVEHEVQVYPGVPHGFAVVGEYDDANIKVAQATAYDQMLNWLKEH
ncbi:Alpha/Beta hydrolase protein [Chaetomium sp. MPI-SDFR-AT-0129]|nr:Alpha/Beta hydrolase protein [Chaetomium sp. MPI-SDFR-AT-0129]